MLHDGSICHICAQRFLHTVTASVQLQKAEHVSKERLATADTVNYVGVCYYKSSCSSALRALSHTLLTGLAQALALQRTQYSIVYREIEHLRA